DHRLSALAAVTMDMLEQMKRQRPRAVEQLAVDRLQVEQFVPGEPRQQGRQPSPVAPAKRRFAIDLAADVLDVGLELGRGIADARCQRSKGPPHSVSSISGLRGAVFAPPPNKLTLVLPSVFSRKPKPDEPRRTNASSSSSRRAVGMT